MKHKKLRLKCGIGSFDAVVVVRLSVLLPSETPSLSLGATELHAPPV
jgi:hypothetical protein